MNSFTTADLIIKFFIICLGIGLILHGQKIKNKPAADNKFASPVVFIVIGVLMVGIQITEFVKAYQ